MKNLLLCTDGSVFAENSYPYAPWFADRLGGNVKILYVTDIRAQKAVESVNLSGSIGLGTSEELLKQLVDLEHDKAKLNHQKAKLILKTAKAALQQAGVEQAEVVHKTGFLLDCLTELESKIDLIILGKRGETAKFAQDHLGANMERVIRTIHRPCLITPKEFQPISKVLFAYDGSPSCQKILQFLENSTVFNGLELHILTVAKSDADPLAIARLAEAKARSTKAGLAPVGKLLAGHAEEAIVHYQEENGINLLLMGTHGHSRIRHLVIGSTTIQVLRKTSIPVLTFRWNWFGVALGEDGIGKAGGRHGQPRQKRGRTPEGYPTMPVSNCISLAMFLIFSRVDYGDNGRNIFLFFATLEFDNHKTPGQAQQGQANHNKSAVGQHTFSGHN